MKNTAAGVMKLLREEKINTWFDLGLFIDRFKENKSIPVVEFDQSFTAFKKDIGKKGMAFISFYFSIDGVSIEVEKYAKIFRHNLGTKLPIHYISGKFYPESMKIIDSDTKTFTIEEMQGFDDWSLYKDFFFTKLERGSKEYNKLISKFWNESLTICEKLAKYIEDNNIGLLYLINVCSNPGNVSSALACILVSEYMGIPVINNNHDFYWEGGTSEINKQVYGLKSGPRDFFFLNSHLGEFFSQLEVLYPWESRSWINVNINKKQSEYLVHYKGHNPANVTEIGTAVDTSKYSDINKRKRIEAMYQMEKMLSRYHKNALISYSVKDVLQYKLVDKKNPQPIYIGYKTKAMHKFLSENIIFLQPTRVISRKRIELGFDLIRKMLELDSLKEKIRESDDLKLTILISGPIPLGQYPYFQKLLKRFEKLLKDIDKEFRKRVYLGFLFSETDKKRFKDHFENPIGIPELYSISSLILLPSKTEGRGLPILEAAAAGVPIFCRRYQPENVYAEVIGEHLPEKDRLQVIEFKGRTILNSHVNEIIDKVFFPHIHYRSVKHNKQVIENRYSISSLNKGIEKIIKKLYYQLKSNKINIHKVGEFYQLYQQKINFSNNDVKALLNTDNRHYLPGYGRLAFMLYLKSLIDPSSFRKEEQEIRGAAFYFAKKQVVDHPDFEQLSLEDIHNFYNSVDNLFVIKNGEIKIRHDHSFTYRHRNKINYHFHNYTIQELSGMINLLKLEYLPEGNGRKVDGSSRFFLDKNLALSQLTSCTVISIDDREFLFEKLKQNLPMAYFPGKYVKYELEYFVLNSVKNRLNIQMHESISKELIRNNKIANIYVFAPDKALTNWTRAIDIHNFIESGSDQDLKLLYDEKILQIVSINSLTVGIHIPQMGEKPISILRLIMEQNGYLISNRRNAAFMSDILNIDRFHIGRASTDLEANIMGIPKNTGYIQFVPAGVRTSLAYPTPIQTSKKFSDLLHSNQFKTLCEKYGEKELYRIIREDAEKNGSPLQLVLDKLSDSKKEDADVEYSYVSGVYQDKNPWNGVLAKAKISTDIESWEFATLSALKTKTVSHFVKDFELDNKCKVKIAWNGGYILNPELVGKLGIAESYIGSPLGLLISKGETLSAPLFNKPALLIYKSGKLDIARVNCANGIKVKMGDTVLTFDSKNYNKWKSNEISYYDLMYENEVIPAKNCIVYRLAGNTIKEIIHGKEWVRQIPVGLTLCIPISVIKNNIAKLGDKIKLNIKGLENILHAVEAGPMLLDDAKQCLNMEIEGWKKQNSIKTQAARLDYTDMRGPKIAIGIDDIGDLYVLTINGRIRESVGATHYDMAAILEKYNIQKAMGFDPGGSSTLVVNGKNLNISPYNSKYEQNNFSLPPEPRAVSNAVIGYKKD
nr:phosphodiester glycosidase family protein [uncultured Marinifilum sp.]